MSIWKRDKKRGAVTSAVQTARGYKGGLYAFDRTGARPETRIYDALRENIPIIDAAISKIVRLMGSFKVKCGSDGAQKRLEDFLHSVPCGPVSRGIDSFISAVANSMLTYGTAVSELLYDGEGHLAALYNADLEDVELRLGKSPVSAEILSRGGTFCESVPHPERIVITALNPDAGSVWGNSLLKGLPFVSGILYKIYECIGNNFERMGNLRYAVTYRPTPGSAEAAMGEDRAEEIATAWSQAMSDKSRVHDFVAVGDVDIKVIGADNRLTDVEIPVRTILEQIVSKTGLPPFLLGLSWSSTERMSAQQADILTSELEYYRSLLEPVIIKICRAYLMGEGYSPDFTLEWNNISLQDETELARGRLLSAQADKIYDEIGKETE